MTTTIASSTDLSGQTIAGGRYHVDRKLGTGSMGNVFLGMTSTSRPKSWSRSRRWQRGLRTRSSGPGSCRSPASSSSFRHPHIVRILDVGEYKAVPYFVMQYVGGGDLDDRIYDSRQ